VSVLRSRERFKRLTVVGALATIYAAGWLGAAWRASRIGEAECTVERVPWDKSNAATFAGKQFIGENRNNYCTVSHTTAGSRHTLMWDHCDSPTRWPAALHPGDRAHCYYYRNFPDAIFFDPRKIVWITPARIVLLSVVLSLFAFGLAGWIAPRGARNSGAATAAPELDAYRVPSPPSHPTPRPPLVVPIWQGGWGSFAFVGWLSLVLGILSVVATALGMWGATGEVTFGDLCIVAFVHTIPIVAGLGFLYRSGLVFDDERGVLFRWWGAPGRWFRTYWPLATLSGAETHERTAGSRLEHGVALIFADGKTQTYWPRSNTRDEVALVVDAINRYVTSR
jgi:hypothetical protein